MRKICRTHAEAPAIGEQGGHVISTDEKTGIQALERLHPTKRLRPLRLGKGKGRGAGSRFLPRSSSARIAASFGGSATMNNQAGYAPMVANNHIYAFGGKDNGPSDINHQTYICNNDGLGCNDVYPPDTRNWTNTEATLTTPRYLMGSALESAFIYLVGGETTGGAATATTERTVW